MKVSNVPVATAQAWAIVNSHEPWTFPSYVRSDMNASWAAFQASYGQGSLSVGDLMERGYHCIEVRVCSVNPYVQRREPDLTREMGEP